MTCKHVWKYFNMKRATYFLIASLTLGRTYDKLPKIVASIPISYPFILQLMLQLMEITILIGKIQKKNWCLMFSLWCSWERSSGIRNCVVLWDINNSSYVLPSSARVNTRRIRHLASECRDPITLLRRVISQKNNTLTQKTTSKPLRNLVVVLVCFCNRNPEYIKTPDQHRILRAQMCS
jgi:hypothetical protein